VPLSLGVGLVFVRRPTAFYVGKRSQLGSWSQTMAHDTASQPMGGIDLSHYAAASAIGAAAPAPSAIRPSPLCHCTAGSFTHNQPYHQRPTRTARVHYTTLGTGSSFRDSCLCSTRLPHIRGGIHFQRLPAGPIRSYLCAFFASYIVPLRGANLLSSAFDDSPLSEALPSIVISAVVAPLRGGLLLIRLDFPTWALDAHLLYALPCALSRAILPSSGMQLQLPFSPSPSPVDAAAAALHVGISLVSSDARICAFETQLCVLRALPRALPRASGRLVYAQPRAMCTSPSLVLPHMHCASLLAVPFVFVSPLALSCASSSLLPSSQAMLHSVAPATLLAPLRAPFTCAIACDTTADYDEPLWLREAGELPATVAYTPYRSPILFAFAVRARGILVMIFIEATSLISIMPPLRTSLVASSASPPLHRLRSFSTQYPLRLAGGGDREDSPSLPCL